MHIPGGELKGSAPSPQPASETGTYQVIMLYNMHQNEQRQTPHRRVLLGRARPFFGG